MVDDPNFLHIDRLGRLVTRQSARSVTLDYYDCAARKWQVLTDGSGEPITSYKFRARPGGGLVGDASLWFNPSLQVEARVELPANLGTLGNWTIDASDRLWALFDPACPAPSNLVVSRPGEPVQVVPVALPEIVKGTETTRVDPNGCSGVISYNLTLHALTNGSVFLVASFARAGDNTALNACSYFCGNPVVDTCLSGAWKDALACPHICAAYPESWRLCAQNATLCSDVEDCTDAAWQARNAPFALNYVYRLDRAAGGAVSFVRVGELPGIGGSFSTVGMHRIPATTDGLTTGIMIQRIGNNGSSTSLDTSAFGLELWSPVDLKPMWASGLSTNRGENWLRFDHITETARKVYFGAYHARAQEVLGITGSHVLGYTLRTESAALDAVAAISPLRGTHIVEEPDGHFYSGVQGDSAFVEWIQKFTEDGRPAVGTSATIAPRCSGSSNFTRFGDPCYLPQGSLTPNYACDGSTGTRISYRCNPTTCRWEGTDCGPSCQPGSILSCPGCVTPVCP